MTEFAKGGIVHGDFQLTAKFVDYPSWRRWKSLPVDFDATHTGSQIFQLRDGGLLVIYADECIISKDKACLRNDDLHRKFPPRPYDEMGERRFWFCSMHDSFDRRMPDAGTA